MYSKKLQEKRKDFDNKRGMVSHSIVEDTRKNILIFCTRADLLGMRTKDAYEVYCEYCEENKIAIPKHFVFSLAANEVFDMISAPVRSGNEVQKVFKEKK